MSRMQRRLTLVLIVFMVPLSTAWSGDSTWELSFEVVSDSFIAGEPIWAALSVENKSGQALPAVGWGGEFYLDGRGKPCRSIFGMFVDGPPPDPNGGPPPIPAPPVLEDPDTVHRVNVNLSDQCRSLSDGKGIVGVHTVCYRDDRSQNLGSNMACDSFVVTMPTGIEIEAYDAFGPTVVEDPRNRGDLLRRFPTSTYAAYVIWQKYAKDWSQVETDRAVATLERPYPFRTVLAPCDVTGLPAGGQETRFGPTELFRCRVAWMERVLGHHPHVWFADEVRLRLALDRYRLDDKTACAAGLEALSEHARPYVAEKAQALLEAMQAKGMLPGDVKDLAAPQTKTPASGSAEE